MQERATEPSVGGEPVSASADERARVEREVAEWLERLTNMHAGGQEAGVVAVSGDVRTDVRSVERGDEGGGRVAAADSRPVSRVLSA
ncbi:hypothetical protein PybrP1_001156 [[Pythium] brassicae (nom. inval.)]|nr:hypothetical protein PybrP1_001156 [[Pythium] brassicae (nom. inval.)]